VGSARLWRAFFSVALKNLFNIIFVEHRFGRDARTYTRDAFAPQNQLQIMSSPFLAKRLRFFGDDFTIAPEVNRRAVGARGLARDQSGAA
jgi:hypothetical protein